MGSLIIILAMFVLLWVLLIRPQRTRQQQQKRLLESIERGDEILTVGGIYGIVQDIDEENDLIVEIATGINVRVARRAVGSVVKPEEEEPYEEGDEDVVSGEAEYAVFDSKPADEDLAPSGEEPVKAETGDDSAALGHR